MRRAGQAGRSARRSGEVGDGRGKEWRGGAARRREEVEGLSVK